MSTLRGLPRASRSLTGAQHLRVSKPPYQRRHKVATGAATEGHTTANSAVAGTTMGEAVRKPLASHAPASPAPLCTSRGFRPRRHLR
ncbi:protein of unknown function [Pararobbsia alpina]